MEWSPEWLVGAGMLVIAALYLRMLRRERPVIAATPEGLAVGDRTLPWRSVQRLGLAAGEGGAELRIGTTYGVIHARDEQLLNRIDDEAAAIARHAGLVPADTGHARAPRDLPRSRRALYTEWRADPLARDPAGATHAATTTTAPSTHASRRRRPLRSPLRGIEHRKRRTEPAPEGAKKAAIGIAALLALLLKFGKLAGASLAWGGKVLKLGSFLPTAASMALSVWAYAQFWGWRFAAGLVGLLFVHELGHAGVMAAKGLRTSPIVFIPGLGALIALKDQFLDARVEAQTGWGGPAVGALGTAGCYLVWARTGNPFWLSLVLVGGMLNLFNLLPVSPLDGGRIVTAISPWLWLPGLLAAGALGFRMGSPLLLMITVLGAFRALREWQARRRGENLAYFDIPPAERGLITAAYFGLCAGLGWLTHHAYILGGPVS